MQENQEYSKPVHGIDRLYPMISRLLRHAQGQTAEFHQATEASLLLK